MSVPKVGDRVLVDDAGTRGHLGVRLIDEPGTVTFIEHGEHLSIELDRLIPGLEGWNNEFTISAEDDMDHNCLWRAFRYYTRPIP